MAVVRSVAAKFYDMNLRPKLIVSFLFSILLPLAILGGILYYTSAKELENELRKNTAQSVEQFNKIFDEYVSQIDTMTLMPYIDKDVQFYLLKTSGAKTYAELYAKANVESVTEFLENMLKVKRDIDFITIASLNGQLVTKSKYGFVKPEYSIIEDPLYQPLRESTGEITVIPLHRSEYMFAPSHDVFSIGRKVLDFKEGFYSGYIVVDCNMDIFRKAYEKVNVGKSGYILVSDPYGGLLYSSKPSNDSESYAAILQNLPKGQINTVSSLNGEKMIVVGDTSDYTGWRVITVLPYSEISSRVEYIRNIFIMLSVSCMVLVLLFSGVISSSVTKPIRRLQKAMKSVEKGNTDIRVADNGNNEVGQLSQSFNRLLDRIEELLTSIQSVEVKKREAQLEALKSKINPHFLYNTLESIRMMAVIEDQKEIARAIEALAHLFRYSIRMRKDMIRVEDELNHVKNYILLQKIRHEDKFEAVYEMDAELLRYKILKFSLQPIVENAIAHGIEPKPGKGIVKIGVKRQDLNLVIEVEDDGVGMDAAKMNELRTYLQSPGGDGEQSMGLKNIHERVGLYFGTNYGLEIDSSLGLGTRVKLTIPAFQNEEWMVNDVIDISGRR